MPNKFLKAFGFSEKHVPADWMTDWSGALVCTGFPKKPKSVKKGDMIIYYAAGRRCVCGIFEVTTDGGINGGIPDKGWSESDKKRWPWWVGLRTHMAIPADQYAPTLEDIGINPLSVRRQSHIFLTDLEYARAVEQLLSAAGRSGRLQGT